MRVLIFAFAASALASSASAFVPQRRVAVSGSPPATSLAAKKTVFIDGEAGTTGIQVRERLGKRDDIEILSAPDELRKDVATRKRLINEADAVILCTCDTPLIRSLPDPLDC